MQKEITSIPTECFAQIAHSLERKTSTRLLLCSEMLQLMVFSATPSVEKRGLFWLCHFAIFGWDVPSSAAGGQILTEQSLWGYAAPAMGWALCPMLVSCSAPGVCSTGLTPRSTAVMKMAIAALCKWHRQGRAHRLGAGGILTAVCCALWVWPH